MKLLKLSIALLALNNATQAEEEILSPKEWLKLPAAMEQHQKDLDLPAGFNMASATIEAKILKVYRARAKSGASFCAYVVKWNDSEIVVNDTLASGAKGHQPLKVGDLISVVIQDVEMDVAGEKMHILQFMFLGAVQDSEK